MALRVSLGLVALLLAGCGPLTAAATRQPTAPAAQSGSKREPDCARQFDAEGAGFQTCHGAGDPTP